MYFLSSLNFLAWTLFESELCLLWNGSAIGSFCFLGFITFGLGNVAFTWPHHWFSCRSRRFNLCVMLSWRSWSSILMRWWCRSFVLLNRGRSCRFFLSYWFRYKVLIICFGSCRVLIRGCRRLCWSWLQSNLFVCFLELREQLLNVSLNLHFKCKACHTYLCLECTLLTCLCKFDRFENNRSHCGHCCFISDAVICQLLNSVSCSSFVCWLLLCV